MDTLQSFIDKNKKSSFSDFLLKLMKEKNIDPPMLYKRAYIDRKLFSKIISDPEYKPSKRIVCALALALHLDSKESKQLVKRAGFILTSGNLFDLAIRYCIENKIYDLIEAEEVLLKQNIAFVRLRTNK
jgi:predicted CopG family antitoxin